MPIVKVAVSYEEMFRNSRTPPIIINDLPGLLASEKQRIDDLVMTRYSSTDMIDSTPSCTCGHMRGMYQIGLLCPECNTEVSSFVESDMEPSVWFRAPMNEKPNGVPRLINLELLKMMRDRFSKRNGVDVIAWLLDSNYKASKVNMSEIFKIKRGVKYLADNLLLIHDYLDNHDMFAVKVKDDSLRRILEQSIDDGTAFSRYIPFPSKSLVVVDNTDLGRYVDETCIMMKDIVNMASSIDTDYHGKNNPRLLENRTGKIILKLLDYHESLAKVLLSPPENQKNGAFRKNIFGNKSPNTFRTVMVSIPTRHNYDDFVMPWGAAIATLTPHIMSKLRRRGYGMSDALRMVTEKVNVFDPLISEIIDEIIAESPDDCLHVRAQRNPTLGQGAAQLVKSSVDRDPHVFVSRIPPTIVKAPNMDFDGDQGQLKVILGLDMIKMSQALSPHHNATSMGKPFELSGNGLYYPKVMALPCSLHFMS